MNVIRTNIANDDWANVQRSTLNFQLSKAEDAGVFHLSVERWKLNVERLPKLMARRKTLEALFICVFLALGVTSLGATDDDAPAPHRPLPSLLQWEAAGSPHDPIESINHHMGRIVGDLSDRKTDLPVQTQQKQVVAELDTVIKQMEDQMKQASNGGGNPNPTQPMTKSVLAKGPGGSGPLHDPRAGTTQWGQLSPKEREQITQSQTEGFPPGYEAVLSSYYNRLAQEKVGSDAPPVEGPTTRP